jgi:hypothetical protein
MSDNSPLAIPGGALRVEESHIGRVLYWTRPIWSGTRLNCLVSELPREKQGENRRMPTPELAAQRDSSRFLTRREKGCRRLHAVNREPYALACELPASPLVTQAQLLEQGGERHAAAF